MPFQILDDLALCHINYSSQPSESINIVPEGLLSESDINDSHTPSFETWETTWCCYKTSDGDTPFDLFAATFFLVSRYEEYLPSAKDAHHRYNAQNSTLAINSLIEEPLVNQWVLALQGVLEKKYRSLAFSPRKFEFISSLDIDQTWKFLHKGFRRILGGFIRDFFTGDFQLFKERFHVLISKNDPYYNFDWQKELHKTYGTNVHYFYLLGDLGKYDKNIHYQNKTFRQLIQHSDSLANTKVGIHPSYRSNTDQKQVIIEVDRLKNILGKNIQTSRQHFLKHSFPETYRVLLECGITEDHTMGYSTHLGFRAGIAAPFLWFDLEKNESTQLRLIPFCAMDITTPHYRNESPEQAMDTVAELMKKVSDVGGLFVSLWHNESLSDNKRWTGWRAVYEKMIQQAAQRLK